MNHQKNIETIFKAMAPYIAQYLTEPKGRSVYDAVYSISVRLKSCDIEGQYPSVETESIMPSTDPKQLFYRLTRPLNLPYRPQISIRFSLDIIELGIYCIVLKTSLIDENNWKEREAYLLRGTFEQLRNQILGANFAELYAKECLKQIKELNTEIENVNKCIQKSKFEETLDINDYDAVLKHVESLSKDEVSHLGKGYLAVNILRGLVLINTNDKKCIPLSDKNGKVLFCSIEDMPQDLLESIRGAERHLREWNMESYSLSLTPFNKNGIAKLTWVISPYYYCPMDEDGFGEEEEFEVAVTCHIDTTGKLVDTPIWKEYIGPRR